MGVASLETGDENSTTPLKGHYQILAADIYQLRERHVFAGMAGYSDVLVLVPPAEVIS